MTFKKYGSREGFQLQKINIFRAILEDNLNIYNSDEIKQLDEIVKKEINILEDIKRFPFMEWIRPLIIGLMITGLLAVATQQFFKGHIVQAGTLMRVYIGIIVIIAITSYTNYFLKDIGRIAKLQKISFHLSELILLKNLELQADEKKESITIKEMNNKEKIFNNQL